MLCEVTAVLRRVVFDENNRSDSNSDSDRVQRRRRHRDRNGREYGRDRLQPATPVAPALVPAPEPSRVTSAPGLGPATSAPSTGFPWELQHHRQRVPPQQDRRKQHVTLFRESHYAGDAQAITAQAPPVCTKRDPASGVERLIASTALAQREILVVCEESGASTLTSAC